MHVGVSTPPAVRDVVDDALNHIRARGFDIDRDSEEELSELVLQGFRYLQGERVLDLPESHPDRREAERRARASLDRFVNAWMNEEADLGTRTLSIRGYARTRSKVCPVHPFK